MCKCTVFVQCTSSQHVECLLRCCRSGCSNDLNNNTTCWAFRRFHKGSCWIMAENLRYIHPLRTRKCLAALLVSELIDGDKKAKKRRGKTRAWTRRRSSKVCYNSIVKVLMIEDTAGYKEIMRMNHGNICIRWALRVRGFNMLGVAVQMHTTLLSHAWMTAKQGKCWALLSEKFDQFQILLNKTQHRSTGCSNALNLLSSICWELVQCTRP